MKYLYVAAAIILAYIFWIEDNETPNDQRGAKTVSMNTSTAAKQSQAQKTVISSQQRKNICRAAIAAIMFKDPKIIEARNTSDAEIISLNYTRSSENSVWFFRCKLMGNRVMWSTEKGRWRDSEYDEKLTFSLTDTGMINITTTFTDGSSSRESYTF